MTEGAREFNGRVIMAGHIVGEAVVSHAGFNTLASFEKDAIVKKKKMRCSDQNNAEIFGRVLTGKILCLPQTIGSTSGGMILQTVAGMGAAPAAMLFSETIDSLAAAGVILSAVWSGNRIVTIDQLGAEFLAHVRQGQRIEIFADGRVIVHAGNA